MLTISKYALQLTKGQQPIQLPYNSSVFNVKYDPTTGLSVYALTDQSEPLATYQFYLFSTGDQFPTTGTLGYIDSFNDTLGNTYHIFME